jgi:hypothetical protein
VDLDVHVLKPAPDLVCQLVGVAGRELAGEEQLRVLAGLLVVPAVDLPVLAANDGRGRSNLDNRRRSTLLARQ